MEEKSPIIWISAILIALIVGAAAGYYYGDKKGYDRGITDAAKAQAGQTGVEINTGYKNPFEGLNLNPFKK